MLLLCLGLIAMWAPPAAAKLSRVEDLQTTPYAGRDDYEFVSGRAVFTFDPKLPANQPIVDITYAERNADGLVEATANFVIIRPRDAAQSNGTVLFEVSNRGGEYLSTMFNEAPGSGASWKSAGNGFLMRHGYTLAWVGWQFDLIQGYFKLQAPKTTGVRGLERWYAVGHGQKWAPLRQAGSGYCPVTSDQPSAKMYWRDSIRAPRKVVPREQWAFTDRDGDCGVRIGGGFTESALYELVYEAENPPVAGVGLGAVRDFIAWMKQNEPIRARRAIGFGYSQSARFLRQFLYDGFNSGEEGRQVFDGVFLAAAGAGRGSFNHRFAEPGNAGNSVGSVEEPVDLFPFTDLEQTDPVTAAKGSLLGRAIAQKVTPKIFHVLSSTEYWARVGSLLHTTVDGTRDLPLAPNSRLYYFAGTPHSRAPFPPRNQGNGVRVQYPANFNDMISAFPALLQAMHGWMANGSEPPPSRYPKIADGTLVPVSKLARPPRVEWPTFIPETARMDFGKRFASKGIIEKQPPERGAAYVLLVPQVDEDGNELGGIRLPHVAVPLATVTGWNRLQPSTEYLGRLAGLTGSYVPLPHAVTEERYQSREEYLRRVRASAESLVRERFLLPQNVEGAVDRGARAWDWHTSQK
jgi:hypothetical protein